MSVPFLCFADIIARPEATAPAPAKASGTRTKSGVGQTSDAASPVRRKQEPGGVGIRLWVNQMHGVAGRASAGGPFSAAGRLGPQAGHPRRLGRTLAQTGWSLPCPAGGQEASLPAPAPVTEPASSPHHG